MEEALFDLTGVDVEDVQLDVMEIDEPGPETEIEEATEHQQALEGYDLSASVHNPDLSDAYAESEELNLTEPVTDFNRRNRLVDLLRNQ